MTDKQPELPAVIPSSRSDNFNTVTKAGNKAVSELTKVALMSPDKIAETIQKMVPEALQMLLEVIFEKSKLWQIIDSDPSLEYYRNLDYDSWVNPADLNISELNQAKVIGSFIISLFGSISAQNFKKIFKIVLSLRVFGLNFSG